MAGYSKRSLVEKLGIKEGFKITFVNPPEDYLATLGTLPKGVESLGPAAAASIGATLDFIQCFSRTKQDVESKITRLKRRLVPNGMLWISWPKGSSRVETDLNENIVREIALKNELVDVKVCAVDETWSGLKLVRRVKDRPQSRRDNGTGRR